jgi:hypothetical protein
MAEIRLMHAGKWLGAKLLVSVAFQLHPIIAVGSGGQSLGKPSLLKGG